MVNWVRFAEKVGCEAGRMLAARQIGFVSHNAGSECRRDASGTGIGFVLRNGGAGMVLKQVTVPYFV